jgi:PAS domain S-box-containing protein
MLVPVALWGWVAFETRANALAAALADQRRVTEAVGEHALKLLEAQAFALDLVDREAGERDCPALRADVRAQDLMRLAAQSPQTETLWIIDADGFLCMASNPAHMDARNRSFREYFIGAREAPPGRHYVDRAIIGLLDSVPAFDVSKVRRKDGAFNGIVLASVSLTELVQYWQKVIDTLPTQRIGLFREDGATIARSWQPLVPAPDPADEQSIAERWRTAPDGNSVHVSSSDGTRRVGAWRSLPDWGVVVASSVDKEAVLAPWRRSTLIYGFVAMVVSGLLGTLTWSMLRERRILARTVEERTGSLRMSEQRLAMFIDRAPAAIAMFDTDMRYLAASRRHLEDYALTLSGPEALLGRSHYEVFPTIPDRWREIHRRVLAGEKLSSDDDMFPREDGRCDWVRWEMVPWYRSDGRPGGALLFSEVLTARKRAEEALRESEGRFRGLVNAASYVVYRMSPDWTEMRQLDGRGFLSDTERPSRTWLTEYIHPDDQPYVWEAIQTAIRTKSLFELEHRVRRADGSLGWTHSRAIPLLDAGGQIREWFGAASDITARKDAEEALRKSEGRLRLATEGTGIGTWELDLVTGQGERSAESVALLGVDRSAFTAEDWVEALHPDDRDRVAAAFRKAAKDGASYEISYRAVGLAPDGGERWLLTRGHFERNAAGHSVRGAGVVIDVTARHHAEALTELNRHLEERVNAEVAAREEAQVRAAHAERMQALGQLAGGIAHDFNNVLQTVEGAAALIERRPSDATGVGRYARLVISAVGRGASVTRRLLAFSHRGDLRAEALDVAALLNSLHEVFGHTLSAAIEVQVSLEDGVPPILADKGQLETAMVNLATNARDAMPEGGRLILSAGSDVVPPDGSVHPAGLAPGRYVRLAVTDTGVGMDPATLARATEPFYTTKGVGVGTGLGLPMVRGFAEQSGGTISIASDPGKGTTVTLWLPTADPEKYPSPATPQDGVGAAYPGAGEALASTRVMVVDDEDLLREVLAEQLEDLGFSVLTAANGSEALSLLAAGETVDALVTDLSMPGIDGIAVIRAAQERHHGLPAVLLTGYAGDTASFAVSGAITGPFSMLRKPIKIHDLVDRIRSLLAAGANRTLSGRRQM